MAVSPACQRLLARESAVAVQLAVPVSWMAASRIATSRSQTFAATATGSCTVPREMSTASTMVTLANLTNENGGAAIVGWSEATDDASTGTITW